MVAIVDNLIVFSIHFRRDEHLPQVNLSPKEVGQLCIRYFHSSVPWLFIVGI